MKIAFYTLGCKVNQYETQGLKENFKSLGYDIADSAEEEADVYVVNTCTVTGLSDRKSRQYIRRMKKKNPEAITAVIGCYAQISPDEVAAVEGVDIVAGTNEKSRLPELIEQW
ncbi:MAG: tRNA (N(6)-L-threonylcarbamoyladenosine(37)-C(2))-methylthiotransferase MtaB, partial [Firmicutes bacterium]|nr:tRNA (N(6)-L-threonylcarbamoyladenosine(37)-C(2))-methylthiotransferase MtaB [Bacillota bacterium]